MKLEFNPRENGACPICKRLNNCHIRKALLKAADNCEGPEKERIELVIYTCPLFQEKG
ncbi:MAG: hypothetical protein ACLFR1_02525 [Spirochaetia bacterium]